MGKGVSKNLPAGHRPCLIRQMHTYAVFQFTECVHLRKLKPAPGSVQSSSSWKCVKGDGDQVESTYTHAHRDIPHRHTTSQTHTSHRHKHLILTYLTDIHVSHIQASHRYTHTLQT